MGGHISVESSVGAGTTFRVALNVAPLKEPASRPGA
jgi:two-component system NtrC family sensor kinase